MALLIAIGTAPLWWRFHFDVPSIDPDAFAALWFWRRGIIEFKAAEPSDVPSLLLYWIGLGSLVVGALWLIIISLWSSRKTLLPLLVAFIACIAAVFICRSAIRAWPAALEAGLQIPKLLLVLRLSLGLALAATALWWFISRALKLTGPSLRSPLFVLVSGGFGAGVVVVVGAARGAVVGVAGAVVVVGAAGLAPTRIWLGSIV